MSFLDSLAFWAGALVIFRSFFHIYQWLISYVGSCVDVKARFETDWALVIGSNSGLGRSLAHSLAAQGVNVIGTGRDLSRLKSVQRECESKNVEFIPVTADLYDPAATQVIAESCGSRDIGVVMINAGAGLFGPISEQDDAEVIAFFQLMANSYATLGRELVARSRERGGKRTVVYFTASLGAKTVAPMSALYFAVKAYVSALAKALAVELTGTNVRITAMHPGCFFGESRFIRLFPEKVQRLVGRVERLIASSRSVAACVMRNLGRADAVDCTIDSLALRALEWAVGELPLYFLGRALFWAIKRLRSWLK
jgi:short-subunit dehydrogenase